MSFDKEWPKNKVIDSSRLLDPFIKNLYEEVKCVDKPISEQPINLRAFMQKTFDFPAKIPVDRCKVKSARAKYPVTNYIKTAYVLMHEKVLYLILDFLKFKNVYGSSYEKKLYKDMTVNDFVHRLVTKRCITFEQGSYTFMSNKSVLSLRDGWNLRVGTDYDNPALHLTDILSYDEIKISGFICFSTSTCLLSECSCASCECDGDECTNFERYGEIIGIPGPSFVLPKKLDYQDILITKEQNIHENGYGSVIINKVAQCCGGSTTLEKLHKYRDIWNKFYEEGDHIYHRVSKSKRYVEFDDDKYFDKLIMFKRYCLAIDVFLLEANSRALDKQEYAYVHVEGFGFKPSEAIACQEEVFFESFRQRLKFLGTQINNIAILHFSGFTLQEWKELKHEQIFEAPEHPRKGIQIYMSDRKPDAKLPPECKNMILVISFGLNSNALPGNEFWTGSLNQSSNSSTACISLMAELLNPFINSKFVNGNSLHIASQRYGIVHSKRFVKLLQRREGLKVT